MYDQTLTVPGISCGHCVNAISSTVGAIPGVRSIDVDLATTTVRVTGDVDEAQVRAAIADAGYDVA